MQKKQSRKAEYDTDPIFPNRWSPRALSQEMISDKDLMSLFEAARWAPSAFNSQPWRFLYARRGSEEWELFFDTLADFNKMWTKDASYLLLVISRKNFEYNNKQNPTHVFDTGAAWENLALQASIMGLVAHGMSGFDYDKARENLEVPDDYEIIAMVAVGKRGKKEDLPEMLRDKEVISDRKKVSEIALKGKFRK